MTTKLPILRWRSNDDQSNMILAIEEPHKRRVAQIPAVGNGLYEITLGKGTAAPMPLERVRDLAVARALEIHRQQES